VSPAKDSAATALDGLMGDLAGLGLDNIEGAGPALGEEQTLAPPGERDMAGKLNLKQVVSGPPVVL
jgi:hypothetical protein